jgi:hypothetical protein
VFQAPASHEGVTSTVDQMVVAAGFPAPEITFNQPVVVRGENKRLPELSVAEAGPAFVNLDLMTSMELDRTLVEIRRVAGDESVLTVMPRVPQVWARKPVLENRGAVCG